MSKFRTIDTGAAVQRVVNGQLRVCSVDNDKNYEVELLLLNERPNANKWQYTAISNHLDDVSDTPILFSTVKGNHAFTIKKDVATGQEYASFVDADSEKPVGWIPKTIRAERNARIVNIDGTEWLSARGILPKFYNKELIDELEMNGGQMSVSIETLVTKNHLEGDIEVEDEYTIVGTTILKQGVVPAVKGANIRKLAMESDTLEKLRLRVASLSESDFIEPQTQNSNHVKEKTRTMGKLRKMEDLKAAFPDYNVLTFKGNTVALLASDGSPRSYRFPDDETVTVVPEKIQELNVNAVFGDGDEALEVPLDAIVGTMSAQLNATKTALDNTTAENAELKSRVKAMEDAEFERRKRAVKEAMDRRKDELIAEYSGELDDDHLWDDLYDDAKICAYAALESACDGFYGDREAVRDVNARCMDKLYDIQSKRNKAKNNEHSWQQIVNSTIEQPTEEDGIAKALDNVMKD